MNESFNAILNARKGPEWCNFRNGTGHHLAGSIALFNRRPGINLGTFDRERDFLLLFIDGENLDLDFLADLEYFTGMIDTAPGELADMHQSVGSSQVNESAKVGKISDHATTDFAWFQLIEQLLSSLLAPFLGSQPL